MTIREGIRVEAPGHCCSISSFIGVTTSNFLPEGFAGHVATEVVAALIAAAILAICGFIASRHIWRTIKCHWRAASIRKMADSAFTIVRCPITNDTSGAIGNEITFRLETAFRVFAGWEAEEARPFQVIQFPLELPSDEGTKEHDRAVETAKVWLERTNGDILIWGKRLKGESIGFIRLIGKDREKGVIEARRIDFDKQADRFDEALSIAIAHEAAALTQTTLAEPERADLDALRNAAVKLRKITRTDAPALSGIWREQVNVDYRRILGEIARRTPETEDLRKMEEEARREIVGFDRTTQPRQFADTALRIATLVRKRNWLDPNLAELRESREFLEEAKTIFEEARVAERAAEAALELLLIRRQELVFVGEEEAKSDVFYDRLFSDAERLVNLSNLEGQRARLAAASSSYPPKKLLLKVFNFDLENIAETLRTVDRVAGHLDNEELLDIATQLSSAIGAEGDRLQSVALWRARVEALELIRDCRESWAADEFHYLKAIVAEGCSHTAQRIEKFSGPAEARVYNDVVERITKEIDEALDWRHLSNFRYIDLRTVVNFGYNMAAGQWGWHRYDRAITALRICAGPKANKFPRVQINAKKGLTVALNNYAMLLDSLEAAEEAFKCTDSLPISARNMHVDYVQAYSAWQIARLTSKSDRMQRDANSRRAHEMAKDALDKAIKQNDQTFIALTHEILRKIEEEFPELAVDLTSAALGRAR